MRNKFQIEISSEEIFVIAGLLGYESMFGIDETSVLEWGSEAKKQIRNIVRRLERKKLLRYDLDGTLYIKSNLRLAIECICEAKIVGLFSTNLKSGKRTAVYMLGIGATITLLEKGNNGKYRIYLTEELTLKELVPKEILSSTSNQLCEKLLFEEAEIVRKQIMSFNYEQAEERLQKHVKDVESVPALTKIFSGNSGFMSVQIHKKGKRLYNLVYNSIVVAVDNQAIEICNDENDVLYLESVEPSIMLNQIQTYLELEQKRGAD